MRRILKVRKNGIGVVSRMRIGLGTLARESWSDAKNEALPPVVLHGGGRSLMFCLTILDGAS